MKISRLFDLIDLNNNKFKNKPCFKQIRYNKLITYTYKEYKDYTDSISTYLLELGVKKGNKIITIIDNCSEWNFIDMGIVQTGAVNIPLHPLIIKEQLDYILKQVKPKVIFVSYNFLKIRLTTYYKNKKDSPIIVLFNPELLNNIFSKYKEDEKKELHKKLIKIKSKISTDDFATIIYTSGSTGLPKGAIHTHKNICLNLQNIGLNYKQEAMVVLPLNGAFSMWTNRVYQYYGLSIYYSDDKKSLVENMQKIQPDFVALVPYMLENLYNEYILKNNIDHSISLKTFAGNNIKRIFVGGAAVSDKMIKYFYDSDITICDLYGSSEAFRIATKCSGESSFKLIPNIKTKIEEDGELLIKGETLMYSYNKLKTDLIDKEGWLHTGDVVSFEDKKHFKIISRKSNMFKLSTGKFVSAEIIELELKKTSFIDNVLIYGLNKNYLVALITPNFKSLKIWCSNNNINYIDDDSIINDSKIKDLYKKIIDNYNLESNAYETEKIKNFTLLKDKWSEETGELSNSYKLIRKNIINKYNDIINSMYNG